MTEGNSLNPPVDLGTHRQILNSLVRIACAQLAPRHDTRESLSIAGRYQLSLSTGEYDNTPVIV